VSICLLVYLIIVLHIHRRPARVTGGYVTKTVSYYISNHRRPARVTGGYAPKTILNGPQASTSKHQASRVGYGQYGITNRSPTLISVCINSTQYGFLEQNFVSRVASNTPRPINVGFGLLVYLITVLHIHRRPARVTGGYVTETGVLIYMVSNAKL